MQAPQNRLKSALGSGEVQLGLWLGLASPSVAELSGGVGFDWCLIDGEHGPNTIDTILSQARALAASETNVVVRVPLGEEWMLKQVLDLGIQTVLVPMIHTAAEAAAVVSGVRYPPQGSRGMGAALARASDYSRITGYVSSANAQICTIVQIESAQGLDNIDAIAATDGVDCVFIGPADLSADMGYPGNPDAPEVLAAIDDGLARIHAAGKPSGIICFDPTRVADYAGRGVRFIGVGSDATVLTAALDQTLRAAKGC